MDKRSTSIELFSLLTNTALVVAVVVQMFMINALREDIRQLQRAATASSPAQTAPNAPEEDPKATLAEALDGARPYQNQTFGDVSAGNPIRIVVFEDLQCGFCRQFHLDTLKALANDPEAPPVIVTFRHFPILAAQSEALAGVVECAGKELGADAANKVREAIYSDAYSETWAQTALGDGFARVKSCIDARGYKDGVEKDVATARRLRILGTPFIQVEDTSIPGFVPYDQLKPLLVR